MLMFKLSPYKENKLEKKKNGEKYEFHYEGVIFYQAFCQTTYAYKIYKRKS